MFEPIYNDGGETIYLFDQIEIQMNQVVIGIIK